MPGSKIFTFGSFPSPLYRAFEEENDARDFVEVGTLVMHSLTYFREIEDSKRRDEGEAEGRIKIVRPRPVVDLDPGSGRILSTRQELGEVDFITASINPCYLYCFAGPEVDAEYLASDKYGKYLLRINEPSALVAHVRCHLEQRPNMPSTMWLHCIPVRYDRGRPGLKLPEPGTQERLLMSCSQKDERDRRDCEYRLVLRLPMLSDPPKEIKVELRERLGYVDVVRWPSDTQNRRPRP